MPPCSLFSPFILLEVMQYAPELALWGLNSHIYSTVHSLNGLMAHEMAQKAGR